MSAPLHVIFGAGQVGAPLAARLLASGHRVRAAKRSPSGIPAGVESALGDAADPEFCRAATQGAAVVYHCMNPPYDRRVWARLVPRYMDNLIAGAKAAGARLVVLDNLYMVGRTGGRPITEDTPARPCSAKGEIRARAAERLFEAHQRGDVRAVTARASDFYGPGGTQTHIGDYFWPAAIAGKTARVLLNPDAVHTYHYIPDVVAGLAALGDAEDADYGRVWLPPCLPAGTMRELVGRFSQALGREIKLAGAPRALVRALGLFVPLMREVDEMLYQWEEPMIVDDRRFRERFGLTPTPAEAAARATIEWARSAYPRR